MMDGCTYLYRHWDSNDKLLYVGISCNAVNRLSTHMNVSSWADRISKITIQRFATREAATKAETAAIKAENPQFNIKDRRAADKYHLVDETVLKTVERLVSFKPVYSVDEAAEELKLQKSQIRRYIESGKLGHITLNGKIINGKPFIHTRITGWQLIDFIEHLM